jgi:hypothetical protein
LAIREAVDVPVAVAEPAASTLAVRLAVDVPEAVAVVVAADA